MTDWLNGVGLVLNMAGAVVAFFFGFPQPRAPGVVMWGEAENRAGFDRAGRRRSFIGLALMLLGFVVQFVALVT